MYFNFLLSYLPLIAINLCIHRLINKIFFLTLYKPNTSKYNTIDDEIFQTI